MTPSDMAEKLEGGLAANAVTSVKGVVSASLKERFWAKVDCRAPDECWPWTGSRSRGYGVIFENNRRRRATQVSWELERGTPFPVGLHACHTCDNPTCVNPAHIWAGTMSENLKDAVRKGRVNFKAMHSVNHNREKTECHKGHPLSGSNLCLRKSGKRGCRECQKHFRNESAKRRRARARAARAALGSPPDA